MEIATEAGGLTWSFIIANEPYSCGTAPDLSGGQIHRLRLLYLPIRGFRYLNRDFYDLKGALSCRSYSNTAFCIAA
jgi:hypothetical protein